MKILVTGATGFIGHILCQRLLLNNHNLIILSRSEKRARDVLKFPFECIEHDLLQGSLPSRFSEMLMGIDAVFHLAGEPIAASRWSETQKKAIYDSRVVGTRNLVASVKAQVFMSTSAVGYYGDQGEKILTESALAGQGFLADVCRDWEAAAFQAQADRTVILRLGVVIAHGEGALKKMEPLFSRGLGGPLGNGKQWMSWIHVDDVVSAMVRILEKSSEHEAEHEPMRGVYNAVSPYPVTNEEFSKALAKSFGKTAYFRVPALVLKLALGEMASMLLDSQRAVPERLLAQGFKFKFETLDAALQRGSSAEIFKQS